jgi:DNA primase
MGAGLNLCPRVEEGISRRFAGEETTRKKTFRQANNDGKNALFRVAEVVAAIAAGRWVLLVEGEKDVVAVESVGGVAAP